ncbi:uncharacterized protein LOC144289154 [Canis aureus]
MPSPPFTMFSSPFSIPLPVTPSRGRVRFARLHAPPPRPRPCAAPPAHLRAARGEVLGKVPGTGLASAGQRAGQGSRAPAQGGRRAVRALAPLCIRRWPSPPRSPAAGAGAALGALRSGTGAAGSASSRLWGRIRESAPEPQTASPAAERGRSLCGAMVQAAKVLQRGDLTGTSIS